MNPQLTAIHDRLNSLANPDTARVLQGFFKTGPGQYGEGDVFLGIKVPLIRKVAAEFPVVDPACAGELLASPHHEARLLALLFWVRTFTRGSAAERAEIYARYLASTRRINNWDLVDASAPYIVGEHLVDRERAPLYRLAQSDSMWERRIAVVATFHFIRNNEFADTLAIADKLLNDQEDLLHKATGWMLREVGKRDLAALEGFLLPRYRNMPRTMLRYAIERFPEARRQAYLKSRL